MNCGIYCIKRYLEIIGIDDREITEKLQERTDGYGLSVQAIIEVLQQYGISAQAYYDNTVCHEAPYLMLDVKRGHYYLIERISNGMVWISEKNLGRFLLFEVFFRLFWQKYYITLCYNTCN